MPRNPDGLVLSHWHTLFEDFSTSTKDFYAAVEAAVRERKLPGVSLSRVYWSEGGIGSPQREYLRVQRGSVAFDICSAPYGAGHFFSWWLAKIPVRFGLVKFLAAVFLLSVLWALIVSAFIKSGHSLVGSLIFLFFGIPGLIMLLLHICDEEWLLSIPVVGYLYVLVVNPATYYRQDTAMMFRDSVRNALNEVINDLREEKGLRLLGDGDLRPDEDENAATA